MTTNELQWNLRHVLLWIVGVAAILSSCVMEEVIPGPGDEAVPVRFQAGIDVETKVSNPDGNQWDAADTIGVYMIRAGSTLADSVIREEVRNKAYIVSSGDGTSSAAFVTAGDMAYYPNGEDVNFIAYYPYSTAKVSTDFKYLMDISDQRQPSRLDLLYSNDKTAYSSRNHDASLPFEHLMTRLVFEIIMAAGSNASLANLQMEIYDVNTSTAFDLSNGTPAADGVGQGVVIPLTRYQSVDSVRMEATLIPTNNAAAIHLYFTLNSKAYTAPLPTTPATGTALLKGKRYTYKVVFDEAEISLEGQLTAWGEEPGDTITPTQDPPILVPHAQIAGYRGPVTVAYASGGQETITLNGSGRAAFNAAYSGDLIKSLTLNNSSTPTPILIGRKVADANPLQLRVDANGKPTLRNAINGFIPIGNYAELQMINDPANLGGKYKQENDIDLLDEDWTPIGTGANLFTGEYDGGEYEIANLKVEMTTTEVGLFGYVTNARLHNIRLVSGSVTGSDNVGSLCGWASGNTSIDNCHSGVDVTNTGWNAGGICGGTNDNITITSCINMGKVKGNYNVGGIVGVNGTASANMK
ncbi:MAG: fimbrillin family protein, partial [Tannerellaceae bacterium]|nr:fimbrillin family protein [Tannerellaceae bacterium]